MEIIDRYVYAVIKRLPVSQREDIERELKTLIEDMIEEYGEEKTKEERVKKVLLDLGNPAVLADNYRGTKRYLIGPENFASYFTVLKIVAISIFIGISVSVIVSNIFSFESSIPMVITEYIATLFSATMQGFAWVTVIFALIEYYDIKENKKRENKQWDLSQLPLIPVKEAKISRGELVVEVIFSTIFTIIFCFTPQVIAAYISNSNGTNIIPVFNIDVVFSYRLLFIIAFILGILRAVLKFTSGRWTLKLAIADSAINVITMILVLIIFSNVWSASFPIELEKVIPNNKVDFIKLWDSIQNGVLISIIIITIMEIASVLRKGIKYKN